MNARLTSVNAHLALKHVIIIVRQIRGVSSNGHLKAWVRSTQHEVEVSIHMHFFVQVAHFTLMYVDFLLGKCVDKDV
jgi:hypothetical protein